MTGGGPDEVIDEDVICGLCNAQVGILKVNGIVKMSLSRLLAANGSKPHFQPLKTD